MDRLIGLRFSRGNKDKTTVICANCNSKTNDSFSYRLSSSKFRSETQHPPLAHGTAIMFALLYEFPLWLYVLCVIVPLCTVFAWLLYEQFATWSLYSCSNRKLATNCGGNSTDYDYGSSAGPHTWHSKFEAVRHGTAQSPINIDTRTVIPAPLHRPLQWRNYERMPLSITLHNTGRAVELCARYDAGQVPSIGSGDDCSAPCSYSFECVVFRWPAEHTVDHQQFALELQALHVFNRVQSPCVNTSATLAVSYLFRLAPNSSDNPYLNPIIERLSRIQQPGTCTDVPGFPLAWLCMPLLQHGFYDYAGSLTCPPCCENVTWLVSEGAGTVSPAQMAQLCRLRVHNGGRMVSNARPVQPLNGRAVHLNTLFGGNGVEK